MHTLLLILISCSGADHRNPQASGEPSEQVVERDGVTVTLRCPGDSRACRGRGDALLKALGEGTAPEQAGAVLRGTPALVRATDHTRAFGSWPVTVPHPTLPEGELLAKFTLTDSAMAARQAEAPGGDTLPLMAVSCHPSPGTAATIAAQLLTQEGPPTQLDDPEAWALVLTAQGVVHELGRPEPQVRQLLLSP